MKKFAVTVFALLLVSFNCAAQNFEPKYYSDSSQNFSGYAAATFLGTLSELEVGEEEFFEAVSEEISEEISDLEQVSKLTKKNDWLFRQALNEWNYEKDEAYVVVCADSEYASEALTLFVVVRGKDDFAWIGYLVRESDFYY